MSETAQPLGKQFRRSATGAADKWFSGVWSLEQFILPFHPFQCPVCGATKGKALACTPPRLKFNGFFFGGAIKGT
jgi:hypothetical protein